jgi:WD40 repeat protein
MMLFRALLLLTLLPTLVLAQPGTRERGRFSLQGDGATWMAIDPGVKHCLIAFNAGSVCVFPADQRTVSVISHPIHKKTVTVAEFLPDGDTFVTVSLDGTLKTWKTAAALQYLKDMENLKGAKPDVPKPIQTVTAHSSYGVTCLAISPDGKRFATGASDGTVKLWDAAEVKSTATVPAAHVGGVKTVRFSPDGKVLATGGADKIARLWDVTGDKPFSLFKLEGHEGTVNAVAFSPDGKRLAVGTGVPKKSGSIHVWDATTGKPAYKLEGHEDVVTCVLFHPKTNHLASGGADKKIRVWNLEDRQTEYTDEHSEPLRNFVISPDGIRFGSCSAMAVRWWAGFGK